MGESTARAMMHFYCRRPLWSVFERMAADTDRPIDDLINEAMAAYAARHGYSVTETGRAGVTDGEPTGEILVDSQPTPTPTPGGRTPAGPSSATPPRQLATTPPPHGASSPTPERPVPRGRTFGESVVTWVGQRPEGPGSSTDAVRAVQPVLHVVADGQMVVVDKDQFVIGRGSKYSDLVIKDPNVSRRHAAVIKRGGFWYIQDLGSTNGIEYKGMRIDNKRIDEGDVFRICDHDLRFTYRSD